MHDCVRVSVHVINHMKSKTAVHGYCINTLLTSMALKCREKERGDKSGEERRERERERERERGKDRK